MTLLLCLGGLLSPLRSQQVTPPVLQTGTGDDQLPAANDTPAPDTPSPDMPLPGATPDVAPAGESAPVMVDPKTGLPITAAEQREKEIDKYDPMKRATDTSTQDANPVTDPNQVPTAAPAKDKSQSQDGSTGASGKTAEGGKSTQGSTQDPGADDTTDASNAEYTGPAVLSRSYTLARPMIPQQVRWRGSVGLSYAWNNGGAPALVNGETSDESTTSQSLGFTWSVAGRHIWRHDQVGVSYTGNSYTYSAGRLGGVNNSLNLDYSHIVSRRISLQVTESVQDLSQNYSLQNPVLDPSTSIANINLATSPSVQLLNSTTRQSSSTASMTYRQTSRTSYNISASYFIIGRTQGVGMTGTQFGGDMNYRWTSRATVGAYYSYTNYLYSHNVSSSDSNGGGAIFSYALSRGTQLQTRFGATRIESLGYESVPLAPELAAILGQGSTIVNAYNLRWTSDVSVQLVRDFRRNRTGTLAYVHGQSPGNGVSLTSVQQTMSAGYSMRLFRHRVPLGLGAVYSTLDSTGQGSLGNYKSESAYVSTSHPVTRSVNGTLSFNYMRSQISGTALLEHTMTLSLGISWGLPASIFRF